MKKYKLYLFDFDGTLVDSFPSLYVVFKDAYDAVGITITNDDIPQLSREPLAYGYFRLGGKPEDGKKFGQVLEEALDSVEALELTKIFPETLSMIEALKKEGVSIGVVTSNKVKHVHEVLNFFNIPLDTFDVYVGNEKVKNSKPHPEPILKALELYGEIDNKDVVYVGDAINDTISANEAGIDAVLIDRINAFNESEKYIKIENLLELI
jgi:HAD superfamily hydrolase (TIGR01549 family)